MQPNHANDHYTAHFATENFWPHPASKMYYTDGVKALAKDNDAFWLVDLVFSLQRKFVFRPQPFQVWELKRLFDEAFILVSTDGNGIQLHIGFIPVIAFPYDSCTPWLVDGCLMLPSEY